jgi:hypothetical protein
MTEGGKLIGEPIIHCEQDCVSTQLLTSSSTRDRELCARGIGGAGPIQFGAQKAPSSTVFQAVGAGQAQGTGTGNRNGNDGGQAEVQGEGQADETIGSGGGGEVLVEARASNDNAIKLSDTDFNGVTQWRS